MVLPQTQYLPENQRKEIKISWIILYQFVAQNATLIHFINMAKINSVIKSINAVFVNINLLRLIKKSKDIANTLLALFAASLHFFITTITIIPIIAAPIRNAIILSSQAYSEAASVYV